MNHCVKEEGHFEKGTWITEKPKSVYYPKREELILAIQTARAKYVMLSGREPDKLFLSCEEYQELQHFLAYHFRMQIGRLYPFEFLGMKVISTSERNGTIIATCQEEL
jgi:hypothetical protein